MDKEEIFKMEVAHSDLMFVAQKIAKKRKTTLVDLDIYENPKSEEELIFNIKVLSDYIRNNF